MDLSTIRPRSPATVQEAPSRGPRFDAQLVGMTALYQSSHYSLAQYRQAALARHVFGLLCAQRRTTEDR